ncbi:MAG: hypothetical protein WBM01_07040 [Mycobacterium sp.]|uniref:hypothetical protein n=1 Tax=Mycobacterium sp. TaxID=1785 RepID=UPI003C742535
MTYQAEFADSDRPRQREAYRGVGTVNVECRANMLVIDSVKVEAAYGLIPYTPICSVSHIT